MGMPFFDMRLWIFGKVVKHRAHFRSARNTGGFLELGRARVPWFLSMDPDDLRYVETDVSQVTYRSITIDGGA